MADPSVSSIAIYQLRVLLCGVGPLVWRRLLVISETSLAELHEILQTAFAWSGEHLHRFLIHGAAYGVPCLEQFNRVLPSVGHLRIFHPNKKENRGLWALTKLEPQPEPQSVGLIKGTVSRTSWLIRPPSRMARSGQKTSGQ
jgi:hypothetical protein